MLIPSVVAIRKTATRTRIEITRWTLLPPCGYAFQRLPHDLHRVARLPTHPVRDLLAARDPGRGDQRAGALSAQRREQPVSPICIDSS